MHTKTRFACVLLAVLCASAVATVLAPEEVSARVTYVRQGDVREQDQLKYSVWSDGDPNTYFDLDWRAFSTTFQQPFQDAKIFPCTLDTYGSSYGQYWQWMFIYASESALNSGETYDLQQNALVEFTPTESGLVLLDSQNNVVVLEYIVQNQPGQTSLYLKSTVNAAEQSGLTLTAADAHMATFIGQKEFVYIIYPDTAFLLTHDQSQYTLSQLSGWNALSGGSALRVKVIGEILYVLQTETGTVTAYAVDAESGDLTYARDFDDCTQFGLPASSCALVDVFAPQGITSEVYFLDSSSGVYRVGITPGDPPEFAIQDTTNGPFIPVTNGQRLSYSDDNAVRVSRFLVLFYSDDASQQYVQRWSYNWARDEIYKDPADLDPQGIVINEIIQSNEFIVLVGGISTLVYRQLPYSEFLDDVTTSILTDSILTTDSSIIKFVPSVLQNTRQTLYSVAITAGSVLLHESSAFTPRLMCEVADDDKANGKTFVVNVQQKKAQCSMKIMSPDTSDYVACHQKTIVTISVNYDDSVWKPLWIIVIIILVIIIGGLLVAYFVIYKFFRWLFSKFC